MQTRLFIENQEVELNSSTSFPITKTFEDLSDPTAIISDWSKTVSIPFTESNNKLFGHIYNPDKAILEGSSKVGVYFDPTKKLDFRLEYMDSVVMSGYAKMASIKQTKQTGSYEVNLFGELGKVFQEMKQITFDRTVTDSKYLIKGEDYVDGHISKQLVLDCWKNNQSSLDLKEKYNYSMGMDGTITKTAKLDYKTTDYINFAPNNSFSKDFDYKTYQVGYQTSKTFAETLGTTFSEATGISGETVIGEGLLPRDIGEFRSYLQLPYIYFNKLFQIFNSKVEKVTGYTPYMDNTWFNEGNPYWKDLVYMLKPIATESGNNIKNSYIYNLTGKEVNWTSSNGNYTYGVYKNITPLPSGASTEGVSRMDFSTGYIDLQLNDVIRFEQFNFEFCLLGKQGSTYPNLYWNKDNALTLQVQLVQEDGVVIMEKGIMVYLNSTDNIAIKVLATTEIALGNEVIALDSNVSNTQVLSGRSEKGWKFNVSFSNMMAINSFHDKKCRLNITARWYQSNVNPFGFGTASTTVSLVPTNLILSTEVKENYKKSYSYFTLNDLWNNEYNVFDQILNYCKIFRIGVFVDDKTKQIKYIPFSTYFQSYTVEDWTDKLDRSKDFVIKPVITDSKFLLFNYKDNPTARNEEYKKKYGVNYGELRLNTDYQFNSETKKLFPETNVGIASTSNVLSWNNIYTDKNVIYSVSKNEAFVENKDKDGKEVDVFGQLFFDAGICNFDTDPTLNLRSVFVSDDTLLQTSSNKFFYAQNNGSEKSVTYPKLSISNDEYLCLFTKPKENYTFSDLSKAKGIYEIFWKDYLNERYNVQNKLVSCYLHIKPSDYINFSFNKLVTIGNQLYMVNKIYDYDITSNESTKVDLITIQDIKGYTDVYFAGSKLLKAYYRNSGNTEWDEEVDYIRLEKVGDSKTIYVTANATVSWEDEELSLQSLKVNGVNGGGTIPYGTKVPVTFEMVGNEEASGTVVLSNGGKPVNIPVTLVPNYILEVYNQGGNSQWNNHDDYISLDSNTMNTMTIYVTSDTDVTVQYLSSNLGEVDVVVDGETIPSGYKFAAGTRIPVTFELASYVDSRRDGQIKLINEIGESMIIDIVALPITKVFKVYYRNNGTTEWDEEVDYILLEYAGNTKCIYVTSNTPVSWYDKNNSLQSLLVNNQSGRGTLPTGTKVAIDFEMRDDYDEDGTIVLSNGEKTVNIPVRLVSP